MPSLTISPNVPQPISPFSEKVKAVITSPPIPLAIGEKLDIRVIDYGRDNKLLLQVKNSTFSADSQMPLQIGDKLTVRVDQLNPSITLRIIGVEDKDAARLNEFVRFYRTNPGAMKEMLVTAGDMINGEALKEPTTHISNNNIQALQKILDQIVISRANVANPLFARDAVSALGLTLERKLTKALSDPALLHDDDGNPNLKETLLKLSSELQEAQTHSGPVDKVAMKNTGALSMFVDRALTIIESLQVVNILAQEQDGLCLFQIPFQCTDGLRMQDVFIEKDRSASAEAGDESYRVVLFLDMDALGDFAVDAGVKNGSLTCAFKSRNQDILDFISPLLPDLKEKLEGIGYRVSALKCTLERDIQSWKADFLSGYKLYSVNTVDLCA
jgi:hypothetical protein